MKTDELFFRAKYRFIRGDQRSQYELGMMVYVEGGKPGGHEIIQIAYNQRSDVTKLKLRGD